MNTRVLIGGGGALAVAVLLIAAGLEQALVIGLVNGALYGLVALGLVLVYKSSGVFNFAQGEFGTVAVYALYLGLSSKVNYVLAVLIALAAATLMGLLAERIIIRPLFSSPRVILLVATAGVALLAIGLEFWLGGALLRNVQPAFTRTNRFSVFGIFVSDQRLLLIAVLAACGLALAWFFNRTNLGLAVLAASQEPTATELVGVSVKTLSSFVWGLAAFLGGLAGILNAPISGSFGPGFMTGTVLIPGFTAAVLGGMTSLPGAFVGGAVVGIAQSAALSAGAFRSIPGPGTVMVFAILLIVLAVRPQGLLGKAA